VPNPHSRRLRSSALLLAIFACLTAATDSFARASGGYSRPGGPSRTPSFGGNGSGYRTPSTSGGYSRPSYVRPPASTAPQSSGDRSFSEGRSGASLNAYRAQQDNSRQQRDYTPAPAGPQGSYQPYQYPPRQYGPGRAPDRSGWFNDRGWSAPPQTYYGGNRSFGVWDGLFLGALLSNLSRPGSVDFFHNNQNDPGYQQWRAEADRQAQDNTDLRQRLDELDRQLAERNSQPRTAGALPPDIPPEVAKAIPSRTPGIQDEEGGSAWVWVVLLAGVGGIAYLAWRRRRPAAGGPTVSRSPANTFQGVGTMIRHKLSGETYTPSKFRVGMTLALDPTPFILAASSIKAPQPEGSGQVSVSAVGCVVSGNTQLVRLYLPDGRSLVQLHLDAAGDPDECRLFGTIDEITPADPGEWSAWLDANEGMIGWPAFQTKDGKTYTRAWVPGDTRISPRVLTETIESLSGTRTVQSQAMLYAAPTGAADPAPVTEYIMVAAVRDGGRAWVEVRAGIDLNPVTLQLA
jgi:uncharacterized protein DUF2491